MTSECQSSSKFAIGNEGRYDAPGKTKRISRNNGSVKVIVGESDIGDGVVENYSSCGCDTGNRSSSPSSSDSPSPTGRIRGARGEMEEQRKKNSIQSGTCPWLIASGVVGCSAMLAKETGITILGINLLYDLYTNLHFLQRQRRSRWFLLSKSNENGFRKGQQHQFQRMKHRITLLITLVAVSLGFRIAIMNGTFPRFSRQDNPAAYAKSDLTRFLTYAFLPVFNFWLILNPNRLSYDWQMGSIPLIESPWDSRNVVTVLFYLGFFFLLQRAIQHKKRGESQKQVVYERRDGWKPDVFLIRGCYYCGGDSHHHSRYGDFNSHNSTLKSWRTGDIDKRLSSSSSCGVVSGTIVFVALLFLSVPFLPASNLLFPVGFVVAERILYTPSLGVCILVVHGMEYIYSYVKSLRRGTTIGHSPTESISLKPRISRIGGNVRSNNSERHADILLQKLAISLPLFLLLVSFGFRTCNRNLVWQSRVSLFTSGIKDNPQNAKMHYNFANLQKDLGNATEAIKHYTIAIRLWPEYASAHNNLGTLLEDPVVAEHQFLRAIRGNQAHGGAHFNLGVLYMRNEKYKEALEHLEECLNIDPSHVEALQYLGACYNILNKTHEAENVFHKLISSDLPPSKLHTNFGVFLQELGLNSEALTHFLLALTKTSWDMEALVHAAKLAFHVGSDKLFQELAERLLSLNFDQSIAHLLAQSYRESGRLHEAKQLFEKLASGPSSFYKIHYAQMLIDVRRWTEAERALREISELRDDPYHSYSILLLGQLYERMNRTGEAFELLSCAVDQFCPRETNLCSQLYSQLGNLMHTTGAMTSAANYYDLAIKFNPLSIQAHTNIGAIYHLMNDFHQAEFHYNEALKIEPDNSIVLSNMRKLQRALGVPTPASSANTSISALTKKP